MDQQPFRTRVDIIRDALEKCIISLEVYVHGGNPNSSYRDGINPFYVMGSNEALAAAKAALEVLNGGSQIKAKA